MTELITIGTLTVELELWEPGPGYTPEEIEAMSGIKGELPEGGGHDTD